MDSSVTVGGLPYIDELVATVGRAVTTDTGTLVGYCRDESVLTPAGEPSALVRARSIDDVVATLRCAHRFDIPVVTRGAGTGLAGGGNGLDGCIVLSMADMNSIIDIDTETRTAIVEPGVINADLASAAAKRGLWYVPDPGSRAISTIGGNLATNAGGACCAKYGVTGDHVARIMAVLADGTIINTGSDTRKNVAGMNLTQLLVGSEGTLAVIVEATMRLRVAPAAPSTVVAFFPTVAHAVAAVLAVTAEAEPQVVELMDRTTISAVDDMTRMGLDPTAGALLLIQCDGRAREVEAALCAEACTAQGATEVYSTDDSEEGESLMHARRVALTALGRAGSTLLDDLVVPVPKLAAMLDAVERAATGHGVRIGTFGHAADGNLHPTIIFDETDPRACEQALRAFEEMVEACLGLGGSLTGEHGIGVLKRPYLDLMVGSTERKIMDGIKRVFDPTMILNPGRAI